MKLSASLGVENQRAERDRQVMRELGIRRVPLAPGQQTPPFENIGAGQPLCRKWTRYDHRSDRMTGDRDEQIVESLVVPHHRGTGLPRARDAFGVVGPTLFERAVLHLEAQEIGVLVNRQPTRIEPQRRRHRELFECAGQRRDENPVSESTAWFDGRPPDRPVARGKATRGDQRAQRCFKGRRRCHATESTSICRGTSIVRTATAARRRFPLPWSANLVGAVRCFFGRGAFAFLAVVSRDEHVERRDDEQREERADRSCRRRARCRSSFARRRRRRSPA